MELLFDRLIFLSLSNNPMDSAVEIAGVEVSVEEAELSEMDVLESSVIASRLPLAMAEVLSAFEFAIVSETLRASSIGAPGNIRRKPEIEAGCNPVFVSLVDDNMEIDDSMGSLDLSPDELETYKKSPSQIALTTASSRSRKSL
jgi:hypothetical protein